MIVYGHSSASVVNYLALTVIAALVGGSTWLALHMAAPIGARLGKTGINVLTRMMGLLLAAIAVEMTANGLRDLFPALGTCPR